MHVLAEAQEQLAELTDYPVAPVISMVGCITVLALTQVVEGIVTGRRMARRLAKQKAAKEARAAATAERAAAASTAGAASMTPTAAAAVLALGGNGGGLVELTTTPRGSGEEAAGGVDPMHEHQRQLMEKLSLARLTVPEEEGVSSAPTSADGRQPPQQQETGGVRYDETALAAMEAGRAPLCSETSSLNTPRNYSRANSLTPRNNPNADLMDLSRSFGPASTSSRGGGRGGGGAWYLRSPSSKRAASMTRRQSSFQLFHQHGHEGSIVYSFKKEESVIVAYLMEIGIVFHSVLIGIGLGVIQSDVAEVRTLLLAICVHQFFEGCVPAVCTHVVRPSLLLKEWIRDALLKTADLSSTHQETPLLRRTLNLCTHNSAGLATCILEAQLERRKNFYMFGLFSVTTSTGVALGIALASIYDPESTSAALLEGCFNSFASGACVPAGLSERRSSRLLGPACDWLAGLVDYEW